MMEKTHLGLIHQLRGGGLESWQEAERVYRPMISSWLRRFAVQTVDADDIVQEVMMVMSQKIGTFEHNGRVGAFRAWLKSITVNACRNHVYKQNRHPSGSGKTEFLDMLEQLHL